MSLIDILIHTSFLIVFVVLIIAMYKDYQSVNKMTDRYTRDTIEAWHLNDLLHREDGPAIEYPDGSKEWWLNGEELTKEEFNKRLNKIDLHEVILNAIKNHDYKHDLSEAEIEIKVSVRFPDIVYGLFPGKYKMEQLGG